MAEDRDDPTRTNVPAIPLDLDSARSDQSSGYSGERDGFKLAYLEEINLEQKLIRITRPIKTWKDYMKSVALYVAGFLSGLLCNYIASYLWTKYPF